MSSCSIWFSAPSFWMGGGLESRCVGRVYDLRSGSLMLLMMGVCTRNMSSLENTNKITLFHQVGISYYFVPGFVSLHYSKWNDALRIQSNVSFYRPTFPDLMIYRGVPSAEYCYRTNYVKIAMIQS